MRCPGFNSDLYDLFSLGVLETEEALELRDHLARNCETCQAGIRSGSGVVGRMTAFVPWVEPPRGLRKRIILAVQPEPPARVASFRIPWFAWPVAAAILALGLGLGWFLRPPNAVEAPVVVENVPPPQPPPSAAVPQPLPQTPAPRDTRLTEEQRRTAELAADLRSTEAKLAEAHQALEAERNRPKPSTATVQPAPTPQPRETAHDPQASSYQARIDALEKQNRFYQTALAHQASPQKPPENLAQILSSPELKIVQLQATESGSGSSARAVLLPGSRIIFSAFRLPTLAAGRTYQLWIMRAKGAPVVSGGTFEPNSSHSATLEIRNSELAADWNALAVTEEPAGGVPLPTGHKILFGLAKI